MWYKNLGGSGAWSDWYNAHRDKAVRARHDLVFDYLECRQPNEWRGPHAEQMGDGIVEIKIHTKVQHRLLGCFGPEQLHFSVLVTCTHKGRVYDPKEAKKTNKKRRKEMSRDPDCVIPCERPKKQT
jgi:hypothetical protein